MKSRDCSAITRGEGESPVQRSWVGGSHTQMHFKVDCCRLFTPNEFENKDLNTQPCTSAQNLDTPSEGVFRKTNFSRTVHLVCTFCFGLFE